MDTDTHTHYHVRLLATREGFHTAMTEEEERIMEEHFQYLVHQASEMKVILAGPCFGDPVFGLVIIKSDSEDAARAIVEADPAVKQGVVRYEITPMRVSVLA